MTDMVEGIDLAEGAGIDITKTVTAGTRGDLARYLISASGGGGAKLYDYTVTGSDKATIDSFVDGTTAANFSGYDLLEIWLYARTDEAVIPSSVFVRFNNDSTSVYYQNRVTALHTTVSGSGVVSSGLVAVLPGASASANTFGVAKIQIPNYLGTVGFKAGDFSAGVPDALAANQRVDRWSFGYGSTSAISRVAVTPVTAAKLFKVGTRLLIYGR